MSKKQLSPGFTLLEILLVVGIIAVLAGIVIIAINPSKQLATVRNTERASDLKQIYNAMQQYYIDNGTYPGTIPSTLTEICNTGSASATTTAVTGVLCSTSGLVNLSDLVPTYIVAIPVDPQGSPVALLTNIAQASTNGIGYMTSVNTNNKPTVQDMRGELGVVHTFGPESSQLCTAFTYSDWSTCSNSTRTRTITTSSPSGCTGGTSSTTESCIMSYNVIFNANGGTGSMSNQTMASGTSQTLTANGFTKDGYTFTGWALSSGGAVVYDDGESFTMQGGEVNLFAQWTLNATAPAAPTIGTATAGNATATIAFTPNSNGGSPILYYTVTSSPGSIIATGASSPILITGLTNGTGYTFTVTATNIVGTSTASSVSNSVTPADPIVAGLRTGLVAYYPLDTDVNDYAGANNLAANGASQTTGKVAGAYALNGSMVISGAFNGPTGTSYSQSVWFNLNSLSAVGPFFTWGYNTPWTSSYYDSANGIATDGVKTPYWKVPGVSTYYGPALPISITINSWHHFVLTTTPGIQKWYFDGTLVRTYTDNPTNLTDFPASNMIELGGIITNHAAGLLNGKLDEVAFWNRALSATEAANLYNGTLGRSLKL